MTHAARAPRVPSPRASRRAALAPVVALLLAAGTTPAAGQGGTPPRGRALQAEDFYRLTTVGSPALSPDGRWVAYTLTTRVEATNAEPSEVWIASATDAPSPRRVSRQGSSATRPVWRADGRLSFAEGGRAWTLDPATPSQLTEGERPPNDSAPMATREVSLRSPDGRSVAVLRPVAPAPRPSVAVSDFERRHEQRFKGVQFDWLNFQRDGQPYPMPNAADPAVAPPQELFLAEGGAPERQLTRLGLRPREVGWSRDGRLLAFTADSGYRDERKYGSPAVYVVGTDGTARNVTPDRDYEHSSPSISPDGRRVLYTRQLATDVVIARKLDHGGATDLVVRDVAVGGAERVLTADWDYLPANATWSADGQWVYFMGGVGGTTHLFRVSPAGGAVEQVTKGERRITSLTFDRNYSRIAYTVGLIESPAELFVANADGSGERQVTRVHEAFTRDVSLSRAERLQFASRDGTPVEGWLMYPHGYRADGRRYPLVVSNHGGPHSADGYSFDFKSQYLAANGYFVLKVNFRSSTGYGEKFLWGTWGAWGTKDGEDVMAGVDHAIAHYPIDRGRVATIGHSYGGFMTNWLITQYPDRFAAAIPGAGIVNWVSDYGTADVAVTKETEFFGTPWDPKAREIMIRQSPLTYADRVKAPTLFVHGEIDERVPYSEAEQMYVALKKNGVPAKMIRYEGMPHAISGSWNQVHRMLNERRWLDRWVKGGDAS